MSDDVYFMAHDLLALSTDLSDEGKCCIAARYAWPPAMIDRHLSDAIALAKTMKEAE